MTDKTKNRPEDQPMPTTSAESRDVQEQLIELIKQRRNLGIQRYGSPLMTHNGRDAIRDALEEAVDLSAYLMQLTMEEADRKQSKTAHHPTVTESTRENAQKVELVITDANGGEHRIRMDRCTVSATFEVIEEGVDEHGCRKARQGDGAVFTIEGSMDRSPIPLLPIDPKFVVTPTAPAVGSRYTDSEIPGVVYVWSGTSWEEEK